MKFVLTLILLSFFSVTYAEKNQYKTYINEKYGMSFDYPSSIKIEDMSENGKLRIWFHLGKKPVSGVLLKVESNKSFKEFITGLREEQIVGKYKKEITEEKHSLGNSISGIEFVRDTKPTSSKAYYFVFPSIKEKVILSLWHLEDTTQGFMGNPIKEEDAVNEYRHLIKTLKLTK